MARKLKQGLSYFPLDVDIFEDDKLQLVSAEHGWEAEYVAIRLLCLIYKNGYYYKFTEAEAILLAKRIGGTLKGTRILEIVDALVERNFFDKDKYSEYEILTSKGIQTRYIDAVGRRLSVQMLSEYIVSGINDDILKDNVNINSINDDRSTQIKVNKSKVNNTKVNNTDTNVSEGKTKVSPTADELLNKELKAAYKNLPKTKKDIFKFIKENRPFFIDPYMELWNIWADERGKTKVSSITPTRKKHFTARIKEPAFDFLKLLELAAKSNFLLKPSNWFDFDWLIKNEDNYIKIMEGKYQQEVEEPDKNKEPEQVDKATEDLVQIMKDKMK